MAQIQEWLFPSPVAHQRGKELSPTCLRPAGKGGIPPPLQPALGARAVPGNLSKLVPNFKGKNFVLNMHNY